MWSSGNRVEAAWLMEDVGVYPHVSGNILAKKHIPWKNNKGMQATGLIKINEGVTDRTRPPTDEPTLNRRCCEALLLVDSTTRDIR